MTYNPRSYVSVLVQANVPTLVTGEPGTGKTSFARQLAEVLGLHCEILVPNNRQPADIGGYPKPEDGVMRLWPAEWAKRVGEAKGLLVIDEGRTAVPAMQAALLRVINERWAGDYFMGDDVRILILANSVEDSPGGWDLFAPMANRVCHLEWTIKRGSDYPRALLAGEFDSQDIVRLPADWKRLIPRVSAEIAGFLKRFPHHEQNEPREESLRAGAWPSRRTWWLARSAIAACRSVGIAEGPVVTGLVGKAGAEFLAYIDSLDIPTPEEVLANPEDYPVPKRDDKLHVILGSVVALVASQPTYELWCKAWLVLNRAREARHADVAASLIGPLMKARQSPKWRIPKEAHGFVGFLRACGIVP